MIATHTLVIAGLLAACLATPNANLEVHSLARKANDLTKKRASKQNIHEIVSKWDLENLTIAAVRDTPVNWPLPMMNKNWDGVALDLNGTVDLGVSLIKQAAKNQARVIGFPEVWFPGYPKVSFTRL